MCTSEAPHTHLLASSIQKDVKIYSHFPFVVKQALDIHWSQHFENILKWISNHHSFLPLKVRYLFSRFQFLALFLKLLPCFKQLFCCSSLARRRQPAAAIQSARLGQKVFVLYDITKSNSLGSIASLLRWTSNWCWISITRSLGSKDFIWERRAKTLLGFWCVF